MDAKSRLRRRFRAERRAVAGAGERSERIWRAVLGLPSVREASGCLAFRSIPGEPITDTILAVLRERGTRVILPDAVDIEQPESIADDIDVVIVPGVAFTARGERLGQGGGWYDRVLPRIDAPRVGVCFEVCLVDSLPTEPHDAIVDVVVTERRIYSDDLGADAAR